MSADTRAGAAAPRTAMGARRWPVHIVVPLAVAIAIGAILLITGREALTPATPVTVRPAVFAQSAPVETRRAQSGATPEARRSVPTVQAPGWLEPDPFYTPPSSAQKAQQHRHLRDLLVDRGLGIASVHPQMLRKPLQ